MPLRTAGPVDAVCLSLLGATATQGISDVDGAFARAVREEVSPDARVAVTLDYRANDAPMASLMAQFDPNLRELGTLPNSLAMGFAYADSPNLGATVPVYGDDKRTVEVQANSLARAIWETREDLRPGLISLGALPTALAILDATPTLVVDSSDNIGGGSARDGTEILRCLLDARQSVIVTLADPKVAARCLALGVGGHFDIEVGALVDDLHGTPLRVQGRVEWVGEANFRNSGSYMTGFVTSMGLTGVPLAGNLRVVLASLRTMPFDPGV